MRAVLFDAVNEMTKSRHVEGRLSKRREELEAWFASEDRTHPFSFLAICDALGYSASWIRRRVLHPGSLPIVSRSRV